MVRTVRRRRPAGSGARWRRAAYYLALRVRASKLGRKCRALLRMVPLGDDVHVGWASYVQSAFGDSIIIRFIYV